MLTGLSQNNYKIITANYSRCSVWSKRELHEKKKSVIPDTQKQKEKKDRYFQNKTISWTHEPGKHTATKQYLLKDRCCICYLHIVMTITPERKKIKICVSS